MSFVCAHFRMTSYDLRNIWPISINGLDECMFSFDLDAFKRVEIYLRDVHLLFTRRDSEKQEIKGKKLVLFGKHCSAIWWWDACFL